MSDIAALPDGLISSHIMATTSTQAPTSGLLQKLLGLPFSLIRNAAFEPAVTGLLLYGLTSAPSHVREQLLKPLAGTAISGDRLSKLITPLKCLFAIGLVRRAH